MIIYPAIDLKDGQCVRLYKGDMDEVTIYNDDPAAQALGWVQAGFSWIHVVDLDGAIQGQSKNKEAVRAIIDAVDIPVQLGGGIRTLDHIKSWLGAGVSRVILGTAALRNPELVIEACGVFPGQIAVGIDARGGRVAVEGWVETSDMLATELAQKFEDVGVAAIVYTDIDRDGTGSGVNIESTMAIARATSIPVIASGGVGRNEDIEAVRQAGLPGVIVGKALYEEKIDIARALGVCV